jgi:hypothetical protein
MGGDPALESTAKRKPATDLRTQVDEFIARIRAA